MLSFTIFYGCSILAFLRSTIESIRSPDIFMERKLCIPKISLIFGSKSLEDW